MVRSAIIKMGKNKAPSFDGMMDVVFQKKYYKHISLKGFTPEEKNSDEVKWHNEGVSKELSRKMKNYLNYCIKHETRL